MAAANAAVDVLDIPGKGKGLIALRGFAPGDLVISEHPLFTQPPGHSLASVCAALSTLSDFDRRLYFNLQNGLAGLQDRGRVSPPLGIFETNSIPCRDSGAPPPTPPPPSGLFLLSAKCNSSCRPNMYRSFDMQSQRLISRAIKHIAGGEELTVAYPTLLAPRDARQAYLMGKLGFVCACEVCSLSGLEQIRSDTRRERVSQLFGEIEKSKYHPENALRKIKEALCCLHKEGILEYFQASFCYDAFVICIAWSDVIHAQMWVRMAWDGANTTLGTNSSHAKYIQEYLNNPMTHPNYGLMGVQTLFGPDGLL